MFIAEYELELVKVLRIFSIRRFEEVLKRKAMPLGRAIFRLAFESIAIIFIFASCMLRIENRYDREPKIAEILEEDPTWEPNSSLYILRFHDLIYYTVVSMTTTGYGDISPQTPAGQILFIIFFLSLMIVLPGRIQDFQKMSSLTSAFGRVEYTGD